MNRTDCNDLVRDEGRHPSPSTTTGKSFSVTPDCRESAEEHDSSPTVTLIRPEMLSILATSSPEIESLCQMSALSSLDFFDCRHERQGLHAIIGEDAEMTSSESTTPEKRHVPRVSLSPLRESAIFQSLPEASLQVRSPLDDVTRSLCHIRLSTPSGLRSSPSSGSSSGSPAKGPSQLRKPSLHRRVSFDMLPSPSEIASPAKSTTRRHRRNTTLILFSSRK